MSRQEQAPVLVVGGHTGIGQGIAESYGERAVIWSRRNGVDATDEASLQAALSQLEQQHGTPWALAHCVGDFEERPLLETDPALYQHLLHSNLTSALLVLRTVVPAMIKSGGGRVVLFAASGAADPTAKTRAPAYFALKAALVSMARSLAKEVAADGVTVNVVSPGIIRHASSHAESQDRMQAKVPLGRAGEVSDVVGVVRMLLGNDGAYVTGAEIPVDGGLGL